MNAGADAIYMGGPLFSARAFAESSGEDMLKQTIEYCHLRGVSVYMTLNTLMKERELDTLYEYLLPYAQAGLDAVIVQDHGVLGAVREFFPDIRLHMSTQAAVSGPEYARMLKEAGVSRIVTPRELSLKEIKNIYDRTGLEIEAFIHGAMCYSYSGQCLMSSMIGGRSGNRGRCAGTCRLCYEASDKSGRRIGNPREEYLLSMKDLNTLRRLREMILAGVCSFKIEGRMKSPVYVAAVTSVYRKYIDIIENAPADTFDRATENLSENILKSASGNISENVPPDVSDEEYEADIRILKEVFDRGFSDGYLDGRNGREMLTLKEKASVRVPDPDIISSIKEKYIEKDSCVTADAEVKLKVGEPAELKLSCRGVSAEAYTESVVQKAQKRPVTEAEALEKLTRFGGTDFRAGSIVIDADADAFIPVRELNELRRSCLEKLRALMLENYGNDAAFLNAGHTAAEYECSDGGYGNSKAAGECRSSAEAAECGNSEEAGECRSSIEAAECGNSTDGKLSSAHKKKQQKPYVCVSVETEEQAEGAVRSGKADLIYLDAGSFAAEGLKRYAAKIRKAGADCGLRLPHIWRERSESYIASIKDIITGCGFDAFLIRNFDSLAWLYANVEAAADGTADIVLDHGIYEFNSRAVRMTDELLKTLIKSKGQDERVLQIIRTLPLELNAAELKTLAADIKSPAELVVYGRAPMMVTAQCIRKTTLGCSGKPEVLYLKDRKQAVMPVRNLCSYCENTIYNSVPTLIYDMKRETDGIAPDRIRFEFTVEDTAETERIMRMERPEKGGFTRGHFRKSVD